MHIIIIIHVAASVYGLFSVMVGVSLHNIPSSGAVLMKNIGADVLRPDVPPGVNHICGMQYQIVLNITSGQNSTNTVVQICVQIPTQNINIHLHSKPPFSCL